MEKDVAYKEVDKYLRNGKQYLFANTGYYYISADFAAEMRIKTLLEEGKYTSAMCFLKSMESLLSKKQRSKLGLLIFKAISKSNKNGYSFYEGFGSPLEKKKSKGD